VLLALVDKGLSRDDAYQVVQGAAAAAWDSGIPFRETIAADPRVQALLSEGELQTLFDPERFLRNLGGVFERVEALTVREDQ
jgi:adenylosuccinate lyase